MFTDNVSYGGHHDHGDHCSNRDQVEPSNRCDHTRKCLINIDTKWSRHVAVQVALQDQSAAQRDKLRVGLYTVPD